MSAQLHMSLLHLDPVASRHVRRALGDVQELHRIVMSGFTDIGSPRPRSELGVLYRVDHGERVSAVLVQSAVEPMWSDVESLDVLAEPVRVRDASPLLQLPAGATFRFRLLANATRAVRPEGRSSRHAQRVPIRSDGGPGGRIAWLERKAADHGFRVDTESVVAVPQAPRRGARSGGSRITLEGCVFDGLLTVTDAVRFRAAICEGIGRGRAYGYGLLTVARP